MNPNRLQWYLFFLVCSPSNVTSFHSPHVLVTTHPLHIIQLSYAPRHNKARRLYSSSSDEPALTLPPQKQLRKKKLNTFARYLEVESWKNPENRALEPVLRSIGEACKQITRIVQRAQTDDLYGVASEKEEIMNIQGEIQQKLDVVCNNIMLKQFCGSTKGVIAAVASEEEDVPRTCCDIMVCIFVSHS